MYEGVRCYYEADYGYKEQALKKRPGGTFTS